PVGLVNALLRRITTRPLADWLTDATRDSDETDALAIRTSHPRWIVEALRDVVGAAALPALLEAQNRPPRVTLVARPGLCEPSDLPGEPGRLSPFARILTAGGVPGEIPHVRDGRAGVQDEGSQMVAITAADAVLDGRDERWLDLCAGPGGKAALLGAIAAQRGVTLVANELQEHRADLVRQAVRALPDVEVVSYDGCEGPWADESFDRVLVDAPCTGLGALRRRPEARWRRSPEDLELLVPLQESLLLRALQVVRVGGVVTYATCSPHLAETDRVVEAVVGETGAELVSVHRCWPHVDGTDAMFAAALRRR
ncbi:MAG TPA: RsmB/NOP family class I SAM-dependent RNA methyltransferase, partial [Aeromicrobium sp.]|nr:RsmB/NOP family class I SAM-dependent RNA methyltransferase [Aeromicrobium sp.]